MGSGSATGTGLRGRSARQLVTEQGGDSDALRGSAACVTGRQPTCGQRSRHSAAATAQIAQVKGARMPQTRDILGTMRLNSLSVAFPLPGAKTFGDVTLGAVLAAATQLGVPEPVARRIVREVTTRVEKEFARIVAEHEDRDKETPPERALYTAQEGRLLRVVQFITLQDMLRRLSDAQNLPGHDDPPVV